MSFSEFGRTRRVNLANPFKHDKRDNTYVDGTYVVPDAHRTGRCRDNQEVRIRRRRTIVAAGTAASLGIVLPFANAAEPVPCPQGTLVAIHLHADLNGTPVDQDMCLPPDGGAPAPALRGLPRP